MVDRGAVRPVALDHNFPKPIVERIDRFLPEVDFFWIRDIDPAMAELDDHDLVYELHRVGFGVMVTADAKLRRDPRVLVAVGQTRLTILVIERAADDPILATGVLLRDLVPVLRRDIAKGLVYSVRPTTPRERRAREPRRRAHRRPRVRRLPGHPWQTLRRARSVPGR